MSDRIIPSHDDVRHLLEVIHYEDHPAREESPEFAAIKREFHEAHAGCWINNGYCDGGIEIHHAIVEYSASTEVDWAKVRIDHPGFDHVDQKVQMLPLCEKHHRGVGTGIHAITYPAWQLQKYLNPHALALFEAAVAHLKGRGHEAEHINHAAHKMLLHVAGVVKKEVS